MGRNLNQRGKLKIFFSYTSGSGKTRAMLVSALSLRRSGVDVVIGKITERSDGPDMNLLKRFETIPLTSNGEFDIGAALQRKPQIVLIEDIAHFNAMNSRHAMRRQDVEELLEAGIDVYTTLNVHNIESLHETIQQITGEDISESIPDTLFDTADAVQYIDIEPSELAQNCKDAENELKLNTLRELALKRCAERTARFVDRKNSHEQWHFAGEHILVCLSSSPSNGRIIRTAARMANAFQSRFTALYVETPHDSEMSDSNRERLNRNTRLARRLGARIETVFGDDVSYQIAEFARLSGVTRIVVGRSVAVRKWGLRKPSLTDSLITSAPDIDIHIIPDSSQTSPYNAVHLHTDNSFFVSKDSFKTVAILFLTSMVNMAFYNLGFSEASIILVYILGVLLTAIVTTRQVYSIISAVLSVILFNFIFIEPRFSLRAFDPGSPITFAVMFFAAYITGSLTIRLKNNASQSARAAYRTQILLDTDQLLNRAGSREDIVHVLAEQLSKLLDRDIIVYLPEQDHLGEPLVYPADESEVSDNLTSERERMVADWVYRNNKHAGATTDTFSDAACLYLAIRTGNDVYGVVGMIPVHGAPDSFEHNILLSILNEGALALENEKNIREKEEAAVLAKNEAMRANLLRMISHDLRTPLTSISGNASNLLSDHPFDEETRKQIYGDIYTDSMWLIGLVENLLSMTRIEGGRVQLDPSAELLEEIVDEALRHVDRRSNEHEISVQHGTEYLLVHVDAKLIVQVLINLIDNAIKHTPAGSQICVSTFMEDGMAHVRIADTGDGVPDELKDKVFDMFYTGSNEIVDSRRSMGLGLYLCKAVINAHGGMIFIRDNIPKGAIFEFTLPIEEVPIYE